MARSFNEKMEKKRQAEYNPVWHRRMRSVWNMATTASGGVTHYAKFPAVYIMWYC